MKRCPECRRDYYDDSLLYCLDDGAALLDGPAVPSDLASESPTRQFDRAPVSTSDGGSVNRPTATTRKIGSLWIVGLIALAAIGSAGGGYFFYHKASQPHLEGSFKELGSPAYDYYLRGKLDSDSENAEHNANAINVLEDVVRADPTFAPAYAELARAYTIRANDWASVDEKRKLFGEARVAVEKSLALAPDLAEGHLVRAFVMWTEAGRFPHEQTVQSLKRAIEIDPNLANAHQQLGLVYLHIGLFDKARDEDQKAITIDPTDSASRLRLGLIEQYGGDYNKALAIVKTVPTDTNPAIVNRAMASLLFELGRTEEAANVVNDFLAASPDEGGNVTSVKAMLFAKAGRSDDAEAAIRRAIEIGRGFQHFHHTTYNIASAYAMLKKNDEALKWLQFTIDHGFPCYPLFASDRNLDNLKNDDRFSSLMATLKQQWEGYKAKL